MEFTLDEHIANRVKIDDDNEDRSDTADDLSHMLLRAESAFAPHHNLIQLSPIAIHACQSASDLHRPKSVNYGAYTPPGKRKPHTRARSQSTSRAHAYKYDLLKKRFRHQEAQLQIYQDKITDIQDNAEETEEEIKKKYELKLLHLETKYLKEKSARSSCQLQIEKLKQELYSKQCENDRIKNAASGYSTISTSTTNTNNTMPSPIATTHNQVPPLSHQFSSSSVVIHSNHTAPGGLIGVPSGAVFDSPVMEQMHYGFNSPTAPSFVSRSSSGSSTSGESSDSESDSSEDVESNTETESRSDGQGSSSDTSSNGKVIHSTNNIKALKDIERRQPKGFWAKIWSLFGPPDIICTCGDT